MKILLLAMLLAGVSVDAEARDRSFRVHYTGHYGDGHDITIQADSGDEARRTVENLIPDCYVTGVHECRN
jgi:hypothetical protein